MCLIFVGVLSLYSTATLSIVGLIKIDSLIHWCTNCVFICYFLVWFFLCFYMRFIIWFDCVTILCLYLGQWSVLSVSLSCPSVFLFAFEIVYYWTNKDGWMDGTPPKQLTDLALDDSTIFNYDYKAQCNLMSEWRLSIFTARCYAERGYEIASCLSVCLSVCL